MVRPATVPDSSPPIAPTWPRCATARPLKSERAAAWTRWWRRSPRPLVIAPRTRRVSRARSRRLTPRRHECIRPEWRTGFRPPSVGRQRTSASSSWRQRERLSMSWGVRTDQCGAACLAERISWSYVRSTNTADARSDQCPHYALEQERGGVLGHRSSWELKDLPTSSSAVVPLSRFAPRIGLATFRQTFVHCGQAVWQCVQTTGPRGALLCAMTDAK